MYKRLSNKKVFGFSMVSIIVLVALLAVGIGAYAYTTWQTSNTLVGEGSIEVSADDNYSYTLSSETLNFIAPEVVAPNGSITATATINITNTGNQVMNGAMISDLAYPLVGTGWNLTVSVPTIASGNSGVATFTLVGTAPSVDAIINLSSVTCKITPY
jgi:hypothetical protein